MNKISILFIISVVFVACQPASEQPRDFHSQSTTENVTTTANQDNATSSTPSSRFMPFYVFKDGDSKNRYTASGYMPNGKCVQVNPMHDEQCVSGTCIKVVFDLVCSRQDQHWAGVYWLNPPDNWGQQKGGYNLEGAQRLVFQARGMDGQERVEEFKMGGVGTTSDYPDTDQAAIGPVILTTDWREYVIDLRGKDLRYITGGFAWSANADLNQKDSLTFYLDEIRYE